MGLDKDNKEAIIQEYQTHEGDNGSTEVQVALLTNRIAGLSSHLREHKHDEATRHGLLKLVGHRRRLLQYIIKEDVSRYRSLITRLGLRR